jgi:hypothetical protein
MDGNEMKKSLLFAFVTAVLLLALVSGCKQDPDPDPPPTPTPAKPWDTATVSFVALVPGETIDFSPSAPLPSGVTYILTDDKGHSWEPGKNGFNGQVTASDYYSSAGPVTFTQGFYVNGTKITGTESQRTVVMSVGTLGGVKFSAVTSDTAPVTLVHP